MDFHKARAEPLTSPLTLSLSKGEPLAQGIPVEARPQSSPFDQLRASGLCFKHFGDTTLGGAAEWSDDRAWLIIRRAYAPLWRHGAASVGLSARQIARGLAAPGSQHRPLDVLAGTTQIAAAPIATACRAPIFLDIETTGLNGGAATVAFLVGLGWFADGGFHTGQYLLTSFRGERAMLAAIIELLQGASMVVTFNGKSFDLPIMETRWLYHRMVPPVEDLAHLDMRHPARRLWTGEGGGLTDLERSVLNFWRRGDIASGEIPARYITYLRSGQLGLLAPVLEHNRLDVLSLALLTARACGLLERGAEGADDRRQCLGLGRLFERAGATEAALACYHRAAAGDGTWPPASPPFDDEAARAEALARLAERLRRQRQFDSAAATWAAVLQLDLAPRRYRKEAVVALAVHYEHRRRDLEAARAHARRALVIEPTLRERRALERRLRRLDEKLAGMAGRQAALDQLVG